jgi:hypothetical protein
MYLSLKNKDRQDNARCKNRVVRPGEGHDPGIPQEPHDIIPALGDNRLRDVALDQERVHGDNTAFQDQVL